MLNIKSKIKEYIQIFYTATFILILVCGKSNSFDLIDSFSVKNLIFEEKININFSREKVIDKVFQSSFEKILKKILQTKDYSKIRRFNLSEIKPLIQSFEIVDETFTKDKYKGVFNVVFNKKNLSIFLGKKNIIFSEPKETSTIVFPILDDGKKVLIFNDNIFYTKWMERKLDSENINYILPIEEIEEFNDLFKKNLEIEKIDLEKLAKKYSLKNSVIVIMKLKNNDLNTFLKIKFNEKIIYKNIKHKIDNLNNEESIQDIIQNIKNVYISDYWKSLNTIDFTSPLSVKLHLNNISLKELKNFENILDEIDIVNYYVVQEFSLNKVTIKINYFSTPDRLKSKLLEKNYLLNNDSGLWEVKKL